MKKILLMLFLGIGIFTLMAQNRADDIVGYYYSVDPFSNEASQTYIYKASNGTYEGKVCWVGNEAKKPFLNLVFLKGLTFNAKDNEWQNGVLTYPGKSGTYKTYMNFSSSSKLKVRGYWGISMLGKTVYWTKESTKRVQK